MEPLRDRIRHFLSGHGIRLNTDLGQHFLVDDGLLQRIVETANLQSDDHIVEIGPGIGVLTKELLAKAKKVTAIELDTRFIPLLREYVGADRSDKLEVIEGNALQVPFPNEPYKVVANIPYHITSPLLRHVFLESPRAPTTMTLLIQREVAEKICDTENRGLLSIIVALFGTPHIKFRVPKSAFLPPPEVESAVLFIECFEKPRTDLETMERLLRLAKIAFAGKRKMLRNTLGQIPNGKELLEKADIDPTRRPETLNIDEWIRLARESN
jgi:16S rRNA (adenine1518-N6/adenine1519-N6)-dimethyltransferase